MSWTAIRVVGEVIWSHSLAQTTQTHIATAWFPVWSMKLHRDLRIVSSLGARMKLLSRRSLISETTSVGASLDSVISIISLETAGSCSTAATLCLFDLPPTSLCCPSFLLYRVTPSQINALAPSNMISCTSLLACDIAKYAADRVAVDRDEKPHLLWHMLRMLATVRSLSSESMSQPLCRRSPVNPRLS